MVRAGLGRACPHGSRAGSFVFTSSAELVGLVVASMARLVIVPATTLVDEASRLLDASDGGAPGRIGIDVQTLTPSLAARHRRDRPA